MLIACGCKPLSVTSVIGIAGGYTTASYKVCYIEIFRLTI